MSAQDLNVGLGQQKAVEGMVYWGPLESLLALARAWTHRAQHGFNLKHSGGDLPLSYNLLSHSGLGACVIQILLQLCDPTPVCTVFAKIGLFSWLVRDVPILVLLR